MKYPEPLSRAIQELSRLPGIGPRTAQRLAFHLLDLEPERLHQLATALLEVKTRLRRCRLCANVSVSEEELCQVCADPRRDRTHICVVEEPRDVLAIERSGEYSGLYHVLGGTLSPMRGVLAEHLHVQELLSRLDGVSEVILATSTTVEGEATALYIRQAIGARVPVSRIAYGLPVGGDLEYTDEVTLGRAISGRKAMP